MVCRHISLPARLAGLAVLVAAAPALAQKVEIATAPPANSIAYRVGEVETKEAVCSNTPRVEVQIPADAWVELPIGWIAKDEATVRANWKLMSYTLLAGDQPLKVPAGVRWHMQKVRFDCPQQVLEGMLLAPVVYLPPSASERTYYIQLVFKQDLNDGFADYKKGPATKFAIHLQPIAAVAAPSAKPAGDDK